MFKKIEIWILYLVLILSIPFTIGFGFLVRQELVGKIKFGIVSRTAVFLSETPINLRRAIVTLKKDATLVEDRFPLLNGFNGIPNSSESYLLLSRFDGNLNEGIVELVDLTTFKVLHTWNPDIDAFNELVTKNDEFKMLERDFNDSRYVLKHPILLNDGGLVFKLHSPLRKIDACSNLVFQNDHDRFHHSLEADIEGNIWVASHMVPQSLLGERNGLKIIDKEKYYDDGIVKLSPNGEILFEKSLSKIFIENDLEYLLFSVGDRGVLTNDPTHLNDIQPVNYDGEFWKKGDIFLSLRHQSMVILYRPSTNKIIWKGTGRFFHQHDVDILNDHKISIFNNNSKDFPDGDFVDGHNQVLVYDFKTNDYSSYLDESLKTNDVRTITGGLGQILPNGDLFVEETNYGRSLYFNSDGSLKWTHLNRAEKGNIYGVGWSRILYDTEDIKIVNNFLQSRTKCND